MSHEAQTTAVVEALEARQLCSAVVMADLAVTAVIAPTAPIFVNGSHVTGGQASVKVSNLGTSVAAGTITAKFYLSTDQVLDDQDVAVGGIAFQRVSIKPSRTRVLGGVVDPPRSLPAGHYYLFAIITPSGGIVDTNSLNNAGLAARRVTVVHGHRLPPNDQSQVIVAVCYAGPTVYFCDDGAVATETCTTPPADTAPPDDEPTTPSQDTQPSTQPASTQPAATQPAGTQPTDTQPASSQPTDDSSGNISDTPPPDDTSDTTDTPDGADDSGE